MSQHSLPTQNNNVHNVNNVNMMQSNNNTNLPNQDILLKKNKDRSTRKMETKNNPTLISTYFQTTSKQIKKVKNNRDNNNNNRSTSVDNNQHNNINNSNKPLNKQSSEKEICITDSDDDDVVYVKTNTVTNKSETDETICVSEAPRTTFYDNSGTVIVHRGESNRLAYKEKTEDTRYTKTQGYGHCFYLALHQLYIMYITNSQQMREISDELNNLLARRDMEQWIHNCIQWNVPEYSLQLGQVEHQEAYAIWLQILVLWATTDEAINRIQQVIQYFNNAQRNQKHSLPTIYWGGHETLDAIKLPFPAYLLTEYYGIQHKVIGWNNIYPGKIDFTPTQLLQIIQTPYVIVFTRSHYFLPEFYNQTTQVRSIRLQQCFEQMNSNLNNQIEIVNRHSSDPTSTAQSSQNTNSEMTPPSSNRITEHKTAKPKAGKQDDNTLAQTVTIMPHTNCIQFAKIVDKYKQNERTKFFNTVESKQWIENILEEYPIILNQYPHPIIRTHLKYLTTLIKPIQSTICKVPGAAATRKLKAGMVIGCMAGHVVTETHSHAILIKNKQIAPTKGDPWSVYSLINEYIWDDDLNNLEFKANGLIVVKKDADINEGEEYFINYSEYYADNWMPLRQQNELDLSHIACQIREIFPNPPELNDFEASVARDTMSHNIQRLFHDFCHGDILYPLFPLHDFAPPQGLNTEQWIEFVFRCRWTYKNFCFRRLHDPKGWRHPTPHILQVNHTNRHSMRFKDKPYQRYGGTESDNKHKANKQKQYDDDGVVPLQPFPPNATFEYLYATSKNNVTDQYNSHQTDISEDTTYSNENEGSVIPPPIDLQTTETTINDILRPQIYKRPKRKIEESEQAEWKNEVAPHTLRLAGLNVDGCDQPSYYRIFNVMDSNQIDLLLLIDTRLTVSISTVRHALAQTKHKYRLLFKSQENTDYKYRVGGTLFIYNEKICKPSLTKLCPAGSTSIINFRFGRQKMHAIATYWPLFNVDDRSLWSRMKQRSDEEGIYQTPIDYIKATIAAKITEFTYANETCFLFGDFNTDITATNTIGDLTNDKYDLNSFIETTQMHHSSNPTQLQIPSYGGIARYSTGKGCSRIDYQFHNGCHVRAASCFPNDTLFDIGTMHRILFSTYDLTEYTLNKNSYRFYKTIRNVNLRNDKLVLDIKQQYEHMYKDLKPLIEDPNVPMVEKLNDITKQSVDIVQKSTSATRPHWNVYSPQAHASYLELKYVRKMTIFCYNNNNQIKWTNENYKKKLDQLIKDWKYQLWKHARKKDQLYQELYKLNVESYGIQYWSDKTLSDIKQQLKDAITTIKKRLHSRRRQSMRMRFSEKVRDIEKERKEGRVRKLINLVFGSKKKNNTFDHVIKDGEVITDEREVAEVTKDFFANVWFKALPEDGTHISNKLEDFSIFELPFTEFQQQFKAAKIPENILRTLHEAIQQRPSAEKLKAMEEALIKEPTYIEFINPLKKPKENSAPGRSGLSYNMIKLWPEELKQAVFEILLHLWRTNITPEYWKVEMINLIPKSDLPELDKLRPITLLETLRKMWSSIMSNRINEIFATGGYLHISQHGCLKKVGVDEANLGVINQYESSKELTSELYTVFWDKKRAFDRPPKPATYYAMIRVGIIERVTRSLIALGIGGEAYIKTPLLTKAIVQNNQELINQQAFTKETGTPQGDTPSALIWNAFEDILLVATSKCRAGRTSFPTHDGLAVEQESSAFVDDLTSFMGTYEGIQTEADIISAFCIIFGIEISITKLRAARLQWGNAHLPGKDHILVHTAGWIPHEIKLENDGFYKTLGMTIDANPLSITQNSIVRQQILTALALVLKAPVSNESKLVLIKVSLYPKCIYTAKLAAWTLEQYRELDKLFEKAFRKIANCMPTTATALLYMKTTSGGLGLPQFSTLCNKRKLKLLMRLDQQHPYRKAIVKSLIGRGARAQGIVIPAGHGAVIDKPMQQWWITSLLQELAELDLSIHIHGQSSLQNIYQWQVEKPNTGKLASKTYNATIGISTNDEATDVELSIHLRTAQVWAITNNNITTIKEIIGFTRDFQDIEYMVWNTEDNLTIGTNLTLKMHDNPTSPYPVGAFGTHKQTFDQFFPLECTTKLLILSNEKHDNNQLKITAKINQIRNKTPKQMQPYKPPTLLFENIQEVSHDAIAIMTDGGYDSNAIPTKQGGAIVLKHSNQLYTCIKLNVDIPCKSVFPIELAALAIAKIAAKSATTDCAIHSDSKSSINIMKAIDKKEYQKTFLTYAFNQPQLYANTQIQWVKSHVEKRKKKWKEWTDAEIGNYIADKMTLRNWHELSNEVQLLQGSITIRKVMDIQLSTFIHNMQQHNSFSIRTNTGLYFDDIEDTKRDQMEIKYLQARDEYRAKRKPGTRPYWINKAPAILRWTSRTPPTICEKAFRMKVAYNKHWTTGNKLRYTNNDTNCECPNCGLGIETATHILFNCQHNAMETLRQQIFNKINELIIKQKKRHPLLAPIIDNLRDIAYDNNNKQRNNIWNGIWTIKQITTFRNKLNQSGNSKYKIHAIYKLSRIYTDAAKQLYKLRGQIISKKDAFTHDIDIQQKAEQSTKKITEFFKEDFETKTAKKQKKSDNQSQNETKTNDIPQHPQQPIINDSRSEVNTITDDNYTLAATNYHNFSNEYARKLITQQSKTKTKDHIKTRTPRHKVKSTTTGNNYYNNKPTNTTPKRTELVNYDANDTTNKRRKKQVESNTAPQFLTENDNNRKLSVIKKHANPNKDLIKPPCTQANPGILLKTSVRWHCGSTTHPTAAVAEQQVRAGIG